MKYSITLLLAGVSLLLGCATARHADQPAGSLTVRIPSGLDFTANEADFRILVDGRFVGNCNPDGTVLELPTGMHAVVVETSSAYQRRVQPNGSVEIRNFALRGEEHIEVLGGGSKQSVVFNDQNLKSKEIEGNDRP